jgi:hypothetical protein
VNDEFHLRWSIAKLAVVGVPNRPGDGCRSVHPFPGFEGNMRLPIIAAVATAPFLPSGTAALLIWLAWKASAMRRARSRPLSHLGL